MHRRSVYRLRIFLDMKYPGIVEECANAMKATLPNNRVHVLLTRSNCYSVSAYSRSWTCLFPQHGPGMKHTRPIYLEKWQRELAKAWPDRLLKGMIQSDGCRFINTGRGDWRQPRYAFSNVSTDVTSIFCSACNWPRAALDSRLSEIRVGGGGGDLRLAQGRCGQAR